MDNEDLKNRQPAQPSEGAGASESGAVKKSRPRRRRRRSGGTAGEAAGASGAAAANAAPEEATAGMEAAYAASSDDTRRTDGQESRTAGARRKSRGGRGRKKRTDAPVAAESSEFAAFRAEVDAMDAYGDDSDATTPDAAYATDDSAYDADADGYESDAAYDRESDATFGGDAAASDSRGEAAGTAGKSRRKRRSGKKRGTQEQSGQTASAQGAAASDSRGGRQPAEQKQNQNQGQNQNPGQNQGQNRDARGGRTRSAAGRNGRARREVEPALPISTGPRKPTNTLKVIPIGGMREIGKNMFVYEYGNDMIVVDCGLSFPDEAMPGIDVVIPDFSYILQNIDRLRGVVLTHGHEDHIGALPWFLRSAKVPVYGNGMTMALVKQKMEDRETRVKGVNLVTVKDGDRIRVGCFEIEFIHSNHSIADSNVLAIGTPAGTVIHTGDFKIDFTPIDGRVMDLGRIAEIGSEGVLLLVCESTNVERSGYSSSESKVGVALAELFRQATGRIFVTTFSSNVFRIQQIVTAAESENRKVALVGRSMLKYYEAASSLGYVNAKPGTMIDLNDAGRYENHEIVFITTGSQGEPLSALTRMANAEHRQVEIEQGDTVILSSSAIPGNEKSIYRVINELYRRGARVVYESLAEIHVSGHAYQEELKAMHALVRPQFFIPCHGEYRHLYKHAELGVKMGMNPNNVFMMKNGDVFEFHPQKRTARIGGAVHTGASLIDGTGVLGMQDRHILRDRLLLAEDGVITVAVAVSRKTGAMVGKPVIQARGFLYDSEKDRVVKECQKKISEIVKKAEAAKKPLESLLDPDSLQKQLERLLQARTKRQPVLVISVIEA